MNYSNYRFTLDIQSIQSQVSLPVKFGDTARSLYITITDGGVPYTFKDGCRVVLSAIKSDGSRIFNDCIIEKNTIIRYDFTPQTTSCAGVTQCELILYSTNGEVIGSPRFVMVVDERVIYYDDLLNIYSGDELNTIDTLITEEQDRREAEETRKSNENARQSNEETRISNEETRISNEETRISNEDERIGKENARRTQERLREEAENERKLNEEARVRAEGDRIKIAEELEGTKIRLATLEAAATGKLYDTVEESGYKHTTQLPDVLPHGILSRMGDTKGFYMGDNEYSCNGGVESFNLDHLPENDGEFIAVSEFFTGSEIHFLAYSDIETGYTVKIHFVLKVNKKVKLSEATVYYEDSRDGSITNGSFIPEEAKLITYLKSDYPVKIIHGNIRWVNPLVKRIDIGMPYTFVGATNVVTYSHNSYTVTPGKAAFIPCAIPKGTKVTVKCDACKGVAVTGFGLFSSNSGSSVVVNRTDLGTYVTPNKDVNYLYIYTTKATDFSDIEEIKNLRVIFEDPDKATMYDTNIIRTITIPDEMISYIKGVESGVFIYMGDGIFDFLDLAARQYWQRYYRENGTWKVLVPPKVLDVSEYLESDIDIVPLLPGCLVRFINEYDTKSETRYTLSYKEKIGG